MVVWEERSIERGVWWGCDFEVQMETEARLDVECGHVSSKSTCNQRR